MKNVLRKIVFVGMALTSVFASADRLALNCDNFAVAKGYFEAFAAHDAVKMGSYYADSNLEIFQDPIFTPALSSDETKAMWEMLLMNPIEFSVEYKIQKLAGPLVFATWTARYIYSASKQTVTNRGATVMKIENGKIVQQTDVFDVQQWFAMALPAEQAQLFSKNPGLFRAAIRKKLAEYMEFKKLKMNGN